MFFLKHNANIDDYWMFLAIITIIKKIVFLFN